MGTDRNVVRWAAACVLLCTVAGLAAKSARAQTAGEMVKACEIARRGMRIEGTNVYLPHGADVNQCWGFIEAAGICGARRSRR